MPAQITDKFGKASSGTRAEATTLTAQKTIGASSISTAALNGWPTDTAAHFQLYTTDTLGNIVPGSQSDWKGVVSGTTISQLVLEGGSDTTYPIGSIVICLPSAGWADDLVEGILTSLDQDGTLKANAVDNTAAIADNIVTSAKIVDGTIVTTDIATNGVGASNLATNAITLGYAQITANQASIISTTGVQVTGLTASVTIPSGGRRIEIETWVTNSSNTGNNTNRLQIWDGTVGSGTLLSEAIAKNRVATDATGFMIAKAYVTPAAGAKTYNVGFAVDANSATVIASATAPAYLIVKVV